MPTIEIGISLLRQTQPTITIAASVDSGSDGSLFPVTIFDSIGAKPIDTLRVRGILGQSHSANLYSVNLYIGSRRLSGIEIAGVYYEKDTLLGRDVLNQFEVILNGPAVTTEVIF